jgi:hypothetical protein
MSTLRLLALGSLGLFLVASTAACTADAADTAASEAAVSGGAGGEPLSPPPPVCGGIGGLQCPAGMECKLDGPFPDALGRCEAVPVWDRCNVDADCIAVESQQCCSVGLSEAVHKDHVAAYEASFDPFQCAAVFCKLVFHVEDRVPLCLSNRCAMVEPEEIRCGGFSTNPHACPAGYRCKLPEDVADVPGRCVRD